jgi:prepilin-type N-terminal cleavage/methylation domain-containing protein
MLNATQARKAGFTLIELLTVVAIIALLVGIVVPSIQAVRKQAKKTSVQNLQKVLADGCELFHSEQGEYPRSNGGNPFEASTYPGPPNVYLSGAQWLVLQLAGADLQGYATKGDGEFYDSQPEPPDNEINELDWLDWYSLTPSRQFQRRIYANLDGQTGLSPESFARRESLQLPNALTPGVGAAGASEWNNGKIPFAVDALAGVVLYYRANPHAKTPFTYTDVGVYDQGDNAAITGADTTPVEPGFDLGNGRDHRLREIGWLPGSPNARPGNETFAGNLFDRGIFEQTQRGGNTGRVWPHNADTFILISPGYDKIYGTADDVTNFSR